MIYLSLKELLLPLLILTANVLAVKDDQQQIDNNLLPEAMKLVDVNKTIEEVQSILSRNSSLPRLTRGEILALLQDVTKNVQPQSLHQRREKNNNLLLVMPVKVNGSNLENIYSITPVTKLLRPGHSETEAMTETSTKPYNKRVTQKPGGNGKRRRRPSTTTESSRTRFTLSDHSGSTTQAFTKAPPFIPVTTMRPLFLNYVTRLPYTSSTHGKGQDFDLPDSIKNNLQAFDLGNSQNDKEKNKATFGSYKSGNTFQNNFHVIQNISFDSPAVQDTKFGVGAVSTAIRVSDDMSSPEQPEQPRPIFKHPPMISLTDPNDGAGDKHLYEHKNKNSAFSQNQFESDEELFHSSTKSSKFKSKVTSPAPAISSTTAFPVSVPPDSLTPEMKNILVSLGLLSPETGRIVQEIPSSTPQTDLASNFFNLKPMSPSVDPESYSKFKPIPVGGADSTRKANDMGISSDMKDFLASFGLLPDSSPPTLKQNYNNQNNFDYSYRSQKALQINRDYINNDTSSEFLHDLAGLEHDSAADGFNDTIGDQADQNASLSTDMLSDDMKDVLQNLGLIEETMAMKGNKLSKKHVFNPAVHTALLKDSTEAKRIKKLWNVITAFSKDNKTNDLSQDELKMKLDNITTTVLTANHTHESFIMKIINQNKNKMKAAEMNSEGSGAIGSIKLVSKNLQRETSKDPEKALEELENAGLEEAEPEDIIKEDDSATPAEVEEIKTLEVIEEDSTASVLPGPSSGNLNQVMDPPDPLSSHELHILYENHQKNEVKRQQPSNSSDFSSTTFATSEATISSTSGEVSSTASVESSSVTTPSDDAKSASVETSTTAGDDEKAEMPLSDDSSPSASLDQLADSFGGASVASAPPTDEELPAATLRPNGLYFYVDWNTFLNVGEEDKKPVNLRFAPKVGNPRLFLPVTVP